MSAGESPDQETAPDPSARSPKASARSVLDAPRFPVARYRPVVLAALGAGVVIAIGAAFIVAFGEPRHLEKAVDVAVAPSEPDGASAITDRLPARYDDPSVRPPPATAPETQASAAAPGPSSTTAEAPPTRAQQEAQAAYASGPFFGGAPAHAPETTPVSAAATSTFGPAPPAAGGAAMDGVTDKERFIARSAAGSSTLAALPRPALSPFEIKAGAIIPAALVTGLDSDLPGMVIAQVTEPVFDHLTGSTVLIPQGARLIGKYDSQVSYGQSRALVVFTRLIFPSGRSVDLGAMVGADPTGAGGLADRVDNHLPRLAKAVGLSTLVAVGASAAQNSAGRGVGDRVLIDAAGGVAGSASQTGQRIVERDLQRAPTIKVRPGYPVRVLVDKDLVLPPE